jgi:hypothetical protein
VRGYESCPFHTLFTMEPAAVLTVADLRGRAITDWVQDVKLVGCASATATTRTTRSLHSSHLPPSKKINLCERPLRSRRSPGLLF